METFTGLLLDVSGSMKTNAGNDVEEECGEWARSIFKVIENFVRYDVSQNIHIFALCVGAKYGTGIFDVLRTIEQFESKIPDDCARHNQRMHVYKKPEYKQNMTIALSYDHLVEEFYQLVENNGARATRLWTSPQLIKESLSYEMADLLLNALKSSDDFLREFVRDCLPSECKPLMFHSNTLIYAQDLFQRAKLSMAVLMRYKASVKDVVQVMEKAMERLLKDFGSVYSVQRASDILHGCIDTDTLDNHRINQLMNTVKPLILSSTISTQLLPRTIFIKRGWNIEITNNETRLFLQINNHENIHDVCNLARNVVCCEDSLSDLLMSVSLDMYINRSTSGFQAKRQVGKTCYANASAAVFHLSMRRIVGRDGGYPSFDELREEIINLYGKYGAYVLKVLKGLTPKYRLHYEVVDTTEAMIAIAAKRPVLAIFDLTENEWNIFSDFFRKNPTGVLTKAHFGKRQRHRQDLSGHAVVLTSFNSECLRFMNSWGDSWADMGFFRVQNAEVLNFQFIDVFWTLNDLSLKEKTHFRRHGSTVAATIIQQLQSLQTAEYQCPMCQTYSLVTEFSGSLLEAVCPNCKEKIRCNEAGNILALNMYLTSLSKEDLPKNPETRLVYSRNELSK